MKNSQKVSLSIISLEERLLLNSNLLHSIIFDEGLKYKTTSYTILGHPVQIADLSFSATSNIVASELNSGEYSLQSILEKGFVPPNCTFLDLGTNVGITAITLVKLFPSCRVIGVEPAPPNYAAALFNVAANGV